MPKKSDYWTEEQIMVVLYEFSNNSFDILSEERRLYFIITYAFLQIRHKDTTFL